MGPADRPLRCSQQLFLAFHRSLHTLLHEASFCSQKYINTSKPQQMSPKLGVLTPDLIPPSPKARVQVQEKSISVREQWDTSWNYSLVSTRVPGSDGTEPDWLTGNSPLIQNGLCRKIQGENGWASKYSLTKTKLHRERPCSFAFPPRNPSTRGEAGNAPTAQEGPDGALGFYTKGATCITTS